MGKVPIRCSILLHPLVFNTPEGPWKKSLSQVLTHAEVRTVSLSWNPLQIVFWSPPRRKNSAFVSYNIHVDEEINRNIRTRMHSSRMRTARTVKGVSLWQKPPGQRPLPHPLDRDPPPRKIPCRNFVAGGNKKVRFCNGRHYFEFYFKSLF